MNLLTSPPLKKTIGFSVFAAILVSAVVSCTSTSSDLAASSSADSASNALSNPFEEAVSEVLAKDWDAATTAKLVEAELWAYRGNLKRASSIYAALVGEISDVDLAKRYAELAVASEDIHILLDGALAWYERAPEDIVAQELAIRALARMGEVEGAWQIIATNPDNHLSVRVLAAEIRQEQFGPQMQWLIETITANYGARPNSSELLVALSLLSSGLSLTDAAESYASGASAITPEALLPLQLRVSALAQLERNAEAVAVLGNYANNDIAAENDRVQAARLLASLDRSKALPLFERLSAEFPLNKELILSTGQLLLANNQVEEAERYFLKLTDADEQRDSAHFNLGRISESRADNSEAINYYRKVESGDFEFEAKLRAALLDLSSNPAEIASSFTQLLEKFPDQSVVIHHEHGRALTNVGRQEMAVDVLNAGLEQTPDNVSLLYARSIAYEAIDRVADAVADLRAVLAADTKNASALNALGYTLANRTDNYQEAYVLIEKALALRPEDPAIIDSMGWVLYRLERYEESLSYLTRANDALFDEEIVSHLAQVLVALDRVDEAKVLIQESLEKLPDSKTLQELETRLRLPNS